MGDIADLILEGYQCSWCGTMFEMADGFPVLCSSCKATKEGKKSRIPRSQYREIGSESEDGADVRDTEL